MSGPPCGEMNAYLTEKYAAIRRAEAEAKKAARTMEEMLEAHGLCMAMVDPPPLVINRIKPVIREFKQDTW